MKESEFHLFLFTLLWCVCVSNLPAQVCLLCVKQCKDIRCSMCGAEDRWRDFLGETQVDHIGV